MKKQDLLSGNTFKTFEGNILKYSNSTLIDEKNNYICDVDNVGYENIICSVPVIGLKNIKATFFISLSLCNLI